MMEVQRNDLTKNETVVEIMLTLIEKKYIK
jgi:hypothetical protein